MGESIVKRPLKSKLLMCIEVCTKTLIMKKLLEVEWWNVHVAISEAVSEDEGRAGVERSISQRRPGRPALDVPQSPVVLR